LTSASGAGLEGVAGDSDSAARKAGVLAASGPGKIFDGVGSWVFTVSLELGWPETLVSTFGNLASFLELLLISIVPVASVKCNYPYNILTKA
jgi:hypothetical protein